jgi:hypothetical protein
MNDIYHEPKTMNRLNNKPIRFQNNGPPVKVQVHIENKTRQDNSMALLTGFVIGLAAALYINDRKGRSPPR